MVGNSEGGDSKVRPSTESFLGVPEQTSKRDILYLLVEIQETGEKHPFLLNWCLINRKCAGAFFFFKTVLSSLA